MEIIQSLKHAYWALAKRSWVEGFTCLLPVGLGEEIYSRRLHYIAFGEWPDTKSPRRFSEHIKKLMLSADGRSSIRAEITDKEFVKGYIQRKVGQGYTAETIGLLRCRDEVFDFDFPENCAIKATHDSGSVVLRKMGNDINRINIANWLNRNYYWQAREPNYRKLKPKILVEELLVEPGHNVPQDYKVFCFHGVPCFIQVDVGRFTEHKRTFFSPKWSVLAFTMNHGRPDEIAPKPPSLQKMLETARGISAGFSFLRVDFFLLTDRVVIGELTNFPEAGRTRFTPDKADSLAGSLFVNPNQDVEELFGVVG